MQRPVLIFIVGFFLFACGQKSASPAEHLDNPMSPQVIIQVLGVAQDAGYPQINCRKSCCQQVWQNPQLSRMVSCLGLKDNVSDQSWLFDATPDIKAQLNAFLDTDRTLSGIFLTHAHMGHYTGLMHLGREAMGADNIAVYAMPRMDSFLRDNGPWSQLVALENIRLLPIQNATALRLNPRIQVTPLQVPHRDEFSETVGYLIEGPSKKLLFIPDIDKWQLWSEDIIEYIKLVDYAFLDGTFFANGEIDGRDMSQIPHPFIEESLLLFQDLSPQLKSRIFFIHFNHTNPVLKDDSKAYNHVIKAGFNIAREGDTLTL